VTQLQTQPDSARGQVPPVLSAAIAAFGEHGYHGATVRDIAARAGLSVPGMYHHYASKQEMLRALVEESMVDILGRSRDALTRCGDDPVDRFSALVETVVLFMAGHLELAVLQAESRYLEPENWRRYVSLRDEQERLVLAAVSDGKDAGLFATTESAEDATRAVLTLCLGVPTWYRPDGPMGPEDLAAQYVRFCLGIVGFVDDTAADRAAGPEGSDSHDHHAPHPTHRKESP
jgi:AcrR family transcriptional regulator